GTGGHSLQDSTRTNWNDFVADNDIEVQTIGVAGATQTRLQNVDEADGNNNVIFADDFDDLVDQLLDVVNTADVSGNVLTDDDGAGVDSFGADGGRILSIQIDGVVYTYDPTSNQIINNGGKPVQNGIGLEVETGLGG